MISTLRRLGVTWIRRALLVGSAVGATVLVPVGAASQAPTAARVTFGPHSVGFRVVCDTVGRPQSGSEQLLVWYPAQQPATGDAMRVAEYLAPTNPMACASSASTAVEQRAAVAAFARWIAPMFGPGDEPIGGRMFPNDSATGIATRLETTRTRAHWNARPVSGTFPILVFAPAGAIEQSVLLEAIASQGYVVVTFPHRGLPPEVARSSSGPSRERHLATAAEIGRAVDAATRLPNADATRIALMASGSAVAGGVWYHLQSGRLSALVVQGGRFPGSQRQATGSAPTAASPMAASDSLPVGFAERWRVPVLTLRPMTAPFTRGALDSLQRAERIVVELKASHPNSDGIRRLVYPADTLATMANDILGTYVQRFLAYAIEGRQDASAYFDGTANGVGSGLAAVSRVRPRP